MNKLIKMDDEYRRWVSNIAKRFKQSQIKAAVKVNEELLFFYWSLGKDMDSIKDSYEWGNHFYEQISNDLKKELPEAKSFSPRNLLYMHQFFRLVQNIKNTPQLGAQKLNIKIRPNLVRNLKVMLFSASLGAM